MGTESFQKTSWSFLSGRPPEIARIAITYPPKWRSPKNRKSGLIFRFFTELGNYCSKFNFPRGGFSKIKNFQFFRIAQNVTPVGPCNEGATSWSRPGSREGAAPIKIGTRWRFPKSCKKWKWNSSHFAHVFRKSDVKVACITFLGSPTTNFLFIRGPYPAPPGPPAPA